MNTTSATTNEYKERNEMRRENHRLNLMRRKRQQQEYKAVLIDNLEIKTIKADRVKLIRFLGVDRAMEYQKDLHKKFFQTVQQNASALKPNDREKQMAQFKHMKNIKEDDNQK